MLALFERVEGKLADVDRALRPPGAGDPDQGKADKAAGKVQNAPTAPRMRLAMR